MAAASSTKYQSELKVALIMMFFFIYLLSVPVGLASPDYVTESKQERAKLVGSRPPGCANRCLNCKPCIATLVIQPHHDHQWKRFRLSRHAKDEEEDDNYYLLSWKCKCGNKLFQP